MITSFFLKNFKSFREAEMPFAPLTLLIGANASGKSNALEAIRLLSWLAKGSRLEDIGMSIKSDTAIRGFIWELFGNNAAIEVGCTFDILEDGWDRLQVKIGLFEGDLIIAGEEVTGRNHLVPLYMIDDRPHPGSDEISVMYNNFSKGGNKPHISCSNRQAVFYQLETPGRFNKQHEKSQRIIPHVAKKIRETIRNILFLDPQPHAMRGYPNASETTIQENGSNLSAVLYALCNDTDNGKGKLLDFVRSLPEQDIIDINFATSPRREVMVRLCESFGGESKMIDAPLLSDGTLRVLALGAALLSARQGSIVVIEEVDNGVHPSRTDQLIENILRIARDRNLTVLLTSHNPALSDSLPDELLGDVLYCYRDPKEGDSRIKRLRDYERYPELVAQGTLGRLMTDRIIERHLKDTKTPEERKHAALTWLEELKKEVSE